MPCLAWSIEMIAENILTPRFFKRLISVLPAYIHEQCNSEQQTYQRNAPVQLYLVVRELFHKLVPRGVIALQQSKCVIHKVEENTVPQISGEVKHYA
jgi:hypothetical protein